MKTHKLKDLLGVQLKNPEFKKKYESLEDEFTVSKELIALRIQNDFTQKQLAEKSHTSQPAIARLESGKYKKLSLTFLNKVADALGAKVEIHFEKNIKNSKISI